MDVAVEMVTRPVLLEKAPDRLESTVGHVRLVVDISRRCVRDQNIQRPAVAQLVEEQSRGHAPHHTHDLELGELHRLEVVVLGRSRNAGKDQSGFLVADDLAAEVNAAERVMRALFPAARQLFRVIAEDVIDRAIERIGQKLQIPRR